MKKWIVGIMTFIICVLGIRKDVHADVIWEPENSFYKMHANDCIYHNRNYITDGPDGQVAMYKSPVVNLQLGLLRNGERINIYYLYEAKNGVWWGLYDDWEMGITGWIPMDYLELEYDHICFVDEFGNQMKDKMEKLPAEYIGKEIYIWSYPGSKNNSTFVPPDRIEFSDIFEDEVGNTWGHVGYYYGWRNIWVCLDDPQAEFSELYPEEAPVREVNQENTDSISEEIVPERGLLETIVIVAVLIVVLVLVTWKLLLKMKKKTVDTKDDSYE